jgi:hypothetical protein
MRADNPNHRYLSDPWLEPDDEPWDGCYDETCDCNEDDNDEV